MSAPALPQLGHETLPAILSDQHRADPPPHARAAPFAGHLLYDGVDAPAVLSSVTAPSGRQHVLQAAQIATSLPSGLLLVEPLPEPPRTV